MQNLQFNPTMEQTQDQDMLQAENEDPVQQNIHAMNMLTNQLHQIAIQQKLDQINKNHKEQQIQDKEEEKKIDNDIYGQKMQINQSDKQTGTSLIKQDALYEFNRKKISNFLFQVLGLIQPHMYAIESLLCISNYKYLISASRDHLIIIWDLHSMKPIKRLQQHTDFIYSLQPCSQSMDYFISTGADKKVILWNASTGKCIKQIETLHEINGGGLGAANVCMSSFRLIKGIYVAVGHGRDDLFCIRVWNLLNSKLSFTLNEHKDVVNCLTILFNNSQQVLLASGSRDCTIKLWKITTQDEYKYQESNARINSIQNIKCKGAIQAMIYNTKTKQIAVASSNQNISLYILENDQKLQQFKIIDKAHQYQISTLSQADDFFFFSAGNDDFLKIWSWQTGELIKVIPTLTQSPIMSLAYYQWTKKNAILFTGLRDGSIKIWKIFCQYNDNL